MEQGERGHALGTVSWVVVVTVLFTGFGLLFSSSVVRTLIFAGVLSPLHRSVAVEVVQVLTGLAELGISRLYRRATHGDNMGSLAAWLAGWALLLLGLASLAGEVSRVLAFIVLAGALVAWLGWRLVVARRDSGPGA